MVVSDEELEFTCPDCGMSDKEYQKGYQAALDELERCAPKDKKPRDPDQLSPSDIKPLRMLDAGYNDANLEWRSLIKEMRK